VTRREKRGEAWEDDGRTIVNMNVEGMPGYRRTFDSQTKGRAQSGPQAREQLSSRETRMVMLASIKWALLFALGMAAVLVLFVLFCVKVWFA
jgi:hypothetical protein